VADKGQGMYSSHARAQMLIKGIMVLRPEGSFETQRNQRATERNERGNASLHLLAEAFHLLLASPQPLSRQWASVKLRSELQWCWNGDGTVPVYSSR
jgi:hypothetical protein